MRITTASLYLLLPLVGLLVAVGLPSQATDALMLLPSWLFVALPQLCWTGIARVTSVPRARWHIVSVAGAVAFLALCVYLRFGVDNSNAIGWWYAWPSTVLAMLGAAGVTVLLKSPSSKGA